MPNQNGFKMDPFPTPIENVALNFAFEHVGESRYNRTTDEYIRIAAKLPPLKLLHYHINERLKKIHDSGSVPYQICRFRAGDKRIVYEDYPKSVSIEVLRAALIKSGMRMPRRRAY
jgi:hypothetical protein